MNAPSATVLDRAAVAARSMAGSAPTERAGWLRSVADALDRAGAELIPLAAAETQLPKARLQGELARTTFQLRLVAEALTEGSWLELTIDHADPEWPMGARPDLRRMLRPIGPVLIFAAGNFPFAFSVAGGDTATALGAGCPVVLKAHPGHLELSRRSADILGTALSGAGAPDGAFALVEGEEVARAALVDPRIKAASFTGSVRGGRALFDLAVSRPDPIPFYGELGSVNPAFVLASALLERRTEVIDGFVESFTLGSGQFCTKPGVVFLPRSADLLPELIERVAAVHAGPLLNDHTADGFQHRLDSMRTVWTGPSGNGSGGVPAILFTTTIDQAKNDLDALFEESFGPTAVAVEYEEFGELLDVVDKLPGQLTATVHADDDDHDAAALLAALSDRAGRIVWNSWPTGVSVTWAMHHGGGWPATTASTHTSVGPTALRRFLTPVAFQDVPPGLLPELLRNSPTHPIWRRINGVLQRSDITD